MCTRGTPPLSAFVDNPPPLIQVRGLTRTFPGTDGMAGVTALAGADLEIAPREYVAIAGRSGSGKSTLLGLLGLLDMPSSGHYWFNGLDTVGMAERARVHLRATQIGFIFQGFHLIPHRSVRENVELGLIYGQRTTAAERRQAAEGALASVQLSHRLHVFPSTLSGGEQQRVAIARSIVSSPMLLLCDEPTGNLDSSTASSVLDVIDELNTQGLTVVTVTHDADTRARAQRTVELADGHVVGGRLA